MEIERQQKSDSLITSLQSWNRQEQQFHQLFGEGALKDPEFVRMKLRQYDRMYYGYGSKASTTDEKAMMLMLSFQRKKLRKSLYPGLLRRTLHRAVVKIGAVIRSARERQQPIQMPSSVDYTTRSIETPKTSTEGITRKMPDVRAVQFKKMRRGNRKGRSL